MSDQRDVRDVRASALGKYMDEDEGFINTLSKAARRVKIELNHTWNLRFLPVQMGAEKMPYVRIAQHWRNQKPLFCPRNTRASWGGDPEFPCPVCEVADRLGESGDDDIRDLGYRARCVPRFRFWCVVFDKENARGVIEEMPWEEILKPYEFDMYKSTFEDFKKYQKWATTRRKDGSELGILDLDTGVNVLATHGSKGVRLERQEPGPIFDLTDAEFESALKRVWSGIRQPVITIPTERQLLEMAVKFEEEAESGTGKRRGGGGTRYRRDDDRGDRGDRRGSREDDERGDREESSSRRSSRYSGEDEGEPRSRRSSRREAPEGEDDDGNTPPPRRRAAPEPEAESATANEAVSQEDLEKDQIPGAEVPARQAPRRQTDIPPAIQRHTAPTADIPPPVHSRQAEGNGQETAASTPPPRRSAPPQASGVDEEDNVAEEKHDPAPAVKENIEEPPPQVSATAPAPAAAPAATRTVKPDMRERLARISQKESR